jgi:hypothetical protein
LQGGCGSYRSSPCCSRQSDVDHVAESLSWMNEMTGANVELNVAFWVVSTAVALVFAASGAIKLLIPKRILALRGSGWVNDFSSGTVIFVGLTEIIGGLAMLVPPVLKISSPSAVKVGTAGLIIVMLGAAVVHARRREPGMILLNLGLLAVTAVAISKR